MMRNPHIEARSLNAFKENGRPRLLTSGAAAAEAKEADKGNDMVVDKDDSKQAKPRRKQSTCHSKKKKDSSKRMEPLDDNLDKYFGPNQSQNSQETADVTPVNTPKKSEEAKSKNDPDGSSHRRVDKSPKPSSKLKQPVQDAVDSSCIKVHKLP